MCVWSEYRTSWIQVDFKYKMNGILPGKTMNSAWLNNKSCTTMDKLAQSLNEENAKHYNQKLFLDQYTGYFVLIPEKLI